VLHGFARAEWPAKVLLHHLAVFRTGRLLTVITG